MIRRLLIGRIGLARPLAVGASAQPKPPAPPAQAQTADGSTSTRSSRSASRAGRRPRCRALGGADALTSSPASPRLCGAWWYDSGDRVRANLRSRQRWRGVAAGRAHAGALIRSKLIRS